MVLSRSKILYSQPRPAAQTNRRQRLPRRRAALKSTWTPSSSMAPPPRPNPQEVSPSRKICSSHEPDRQPSPTPQAPSQLRQAWTWSAWRRRRAARLVQQPPGLPACNRTIVRQPARVVQRSELQQIPCKQRSGRPLQ
jgi:hypothetical protein